MFSHFSQFHHTPNDFKWTVLEKIDDNIVNSEKILYEREQRWVHHLKSNTSGLNDDVPWNHFYNQ